MSDYIDNEYLEVDLNSIVSKNIAEKISKLEKDVQSTRSIAAELRSENSRLKDRISDNGKSLWILDYIRAEFAKITSTEKTPDQNGRSKNENRFQFISDILQNVFRIKPEAGGWYYLFGESGNLGVHLAVNYYSQKDVVINLLKLVMPDYHKDVTFIKNFKMPFDYDKDDVIKYVKDPKYNTNGSTFGISSYWIEKGAGTTNMPQDLILRNPHILEDDVFEMLLDTIKNKRNNYYYLFALYKYNKSVTKDQIALMGELLLEIPRNIWHYDTVSNFISANISVFNKKTLEYIYDYIQNDNPYRSLYWEKFPVEYQMRFLKSKELEHILKIFSSSDCKWTTEDKCKFLKEFTIEKDGGKK